MPAPPDPAPRAAPQTPAAAGLVALADRCVQCGLCLPHCPTYRLDRSESESPRGRIAYAKAVALGHFEPTAAGDQHLDHCLGCRRCEPVCPAGVSYGELLVAARTAQAARRQAPLGPRLAGWLLARPPLLGRLLTILRWTGPWLPAGLRPALPPPPARVPWPTPLPVAPISPPPAPQPMLPSAHGSAPELPPRPAPGTPQIAAVALFAGCIADTYESGTRAALARLLAAGGIAASLPAGQGCCGAAAAHAGDAATAGRLAAANRRAFAGQPRVLCLASGCHDSLARSLEGSRVEDALAALDALGDRLRFRPCGHRVALHLPCTQRSVVRSEAALRRLLARIPGLDLVELPDIGCCGAAGLHQLAEPARAAALRVPLLEALAASGAAELVSANIGCRLHLGTGTLLPVRHPIDFLAEHLA